MKRQLLLATLFIAVVAGGPCFAGDAQLKLYIPAFNEPIYGTWINEGYLGNGYYPQKFVVFNWGYTETYFKMGDKSCSGRNTFILIEKWQDRDGNTWYTDYEQTSEGARCFYVNRISKDGQTYELMYYLKKLPKENKIDPSATNYRVFHRQ